MKPYPAPVLGDEMSPIRKEELVRDFQPHEPALLQLPQETIILVWQSFYLVDG